MWDAYPASSGACLVTWAQRSPHAHLANIFRHSPLFLPLSLFSSPACAVWLQCEEVRLSLSGDLERENSSFGG